MNSAFPDHSHPELQPSARQHKGHRCCHVPWDWHRRQSILLREGPPHSRSGASIACSRLLFLRVFRQVSGRFWRGGAHNLAQSLCPRQPLPFRSLWKWGSAGFSRGKKESTERYRSLGSFPRTHLGTHHGGRCRFTLSVIHTDWHKRKLLGLFRARV